MTETPRRTERGEGDGLGLRRSLVLLGQELVQLVADRAADPEVEGPPELVELFGRIELAPAFPQVIQT